MLILGLVASCDDTPVSIAECVGTYVADARTMEMLRREPFSLPADQTSKIEFRADGAVHTTNFTVNMVDTNRGVLSTDTGTWEYVDGSGGLLDLTLERHWADARIQRDQRGLYLNMGHPDLSPVTTYIRVEEHGN